MLETLSAPSPASAGEGRGEGAATKQTQIARDDLAACRTLLCSGSKSFFAASLLLPRRVLDPATALYAFCRAADDLIDGQVAGQAACQSGAGEGQTASVAAAALLQLHARLDALYAGTPWDHAADRALAVVVATHRLPRVLLDGLLEGFAWDAEGRTYETLADLQAYATRVAGTVGAMMAVLMGVRDTDRVARACDLGVAMQLSNIARDVGEDARAGRLYLPRLWLREAGIEPDAWLANPVFTPELGRVVTRLVRAADALYRRADAGIAALPLACRPGIGAASRLYRAIGHRVRAADGNAIDTRATVSTRAKLALLARATAASILPGAAITAPPVPAARHLVIAVAATATPAPPNRVIWLLELFSQLDARQSMRTFP